MFWVELAADGSNHPSQLLEIQAVDLSQALAIAMKEAWPDFRVWSIRIVEAKP